MRKLSSLFALLALVAIAAPTQAAWVRHGVGTVAAASNTNTTPLTVNYTAGNASDMVLLIARVNNANSTLTWTGTPTLIYQQDSNLTVSASCITVAGTGTGSVTVSADNTSRVIAVAIRYSGGSCSGTPHASAQFSGAAANGLSWPALTITNNNTLVIVVGGKNCAWTGASAGPGTELVDSTSTSAGLVVEETIQTTASNLSSGSWTFGTDCSAIRKTIAIALDATATPPTFSVSPAIGTRTTSSIPITATTACTDCTFYFVAVTDGSGAPSVNQIKAGQNSSGAAAYSSCSVAMTTTVQGTCTLGSYTNGTLRDGYGALSSTMTGDSSVASIADMYKIPAFTTAISIASTTTTTYTTNSKLLDGPGTVSLVACLKGGSAPSVAQTEAGTGACILNASTDDASGTMTINPSGSDWPVYDLYYVGTYGSQHEAAVNALTGQCLSAPAGKQFINCPAGLTSIDSHSPLVALNASIPTDVAIGDIPILDLVTTPDACVVSMQVDGNVTLGGATVGSVCSSARQYANGTFFDISAMGFIVDPNDLDLWVNNVPPIGPDPDSITIFVPVGSPMTPEDLRKYCTSPQGDTLTAKLAAGSVPLPTNLSVVSDFLQGTMTFQGKTFGHSFECCDTTGACTTWH